MSWFDSKPEGYHVKPRNPSPTGARDFGLPRDRPRLLHRRFSVGTIAVLLLKTGAQQLRCSDPIALVPLPQHSVAAAQAPGLGKLRIGGEAQSRIEGTVESRWSRRWAAWRRRRWPVPSRKFLPRSELASARPCYSRAGIRPAKPAGSCPSTLTFLRLLVYLRRCGWWRVRVLLRATRSGSGSARRPAAVVFLATNTI